MVMQDELNAKLEIVDGRLYIIPIEIEDPSLKDKPDPIELKKRINELKDEAKSQEDSQEESNTKTSEEQKETKAVEDESSKTEKTE